MRRLDIHLRDGDGYDTVIRVVKAADPVDYIIVPLEQRDRKLISVFVRDGTGQTLMDNLHGAMDDETNWRITLHAIEATVPKLDEGSDTKTKREKRAIREELYAEVFGGAKLNQDFLILVFLSTIVAAIGLNSDSAAAVIGAMVIAPLLGPILAMSLGGALGDDGLLKQAGLTLLIGVAVALGSAVLLSFVLPIDLQSRELISRAEVRLDGVALAMAAGGAAALSMAKGESAALVGVMVAAALLPPGAALGLFAGAGEWALAGRAGLLLALNIASLILSALIVFRFKNIRPRQWIEQKNATRATWLNAGVSIVLLVIAVALIIVLDLGARIQIG